MKRDAWGGVSQVSRAVCVCKVLVFKPLCFIISWWFCFSVIKYSSDLGTHTYTLTLSHIRVHTLKHMKKKSHSAIYWSHSLYSLCHGRCRDSLLHHVPLVSITGRHSSATLQRELVCVTVRLWMCSEGKETVRAHRSDKQRENEQFSVCLRAPSSSDTSDMQLYYHLQWRRIFTCTQSRIESK